MTIIATTEVDNAWIFQKYLQAESFLFSFFNFLHSLKTLETFVSGVFGYATSFIQRGNFNNPMGQIRC